MTGGRDSDDEEPTDNSRSARLLMVAVLALAVAATMVLVLTDSARWLRLGVLAALWAALLGVFLASRFRKSATERESEVADLRSSYELELEREVAARREYELEVEAAARKRVDEASREDLAELRAELRHLRESLERLTGGEVLVERFALQAQSTRMRSLSDGQRRVVPAGEDSGRLRRSIVAGSSARESDPAAATELIQRPQPPAPVAPVRREPQRREAPRPVGYRPEPSRPQTSRDGTDDGDRQRRDSAPAAQPTRVARPAQPRQQPVRRPAPAPEAQQQQQVWPGQAPQAQPQRPAAQRPPQAPQPPRRPVRQYVRHEPAPDDLELSTRLTPPVEPPPAHPQPPRPVPTRVAAPVPPPEPARSEPMRPEPMRPEPMRPEPMRPEPARPDPIRVESPGGHRRPAEPAEQAEPAGERSRHSADPDVPKDYQSYREWRQTGESDAETTGAHAAGKSVTELLAAHAPADESPRRHRRRVD